MRTPEQVKWDFVQQWLDRAGRDLATSEILLRAEFEDYENAGFHAQQATEKFIKALLVRHQIPFPKSHDIAVLRQLVARVDAQLADKLAAADALTPYGVEYGCDKAAPMTTAKKITLLGDLENHLIPHTVPIKEKATLGSFAGFNFPSFRNDRMAILPKI